jgi:hypothetical protein
MKTKLLLSLTTGLLLVSAPAYAQVTGTVGANFAHQEVEVGGFEGDGEAYGLNGGITIPTGGSLAVLLDAGWTHADDADTDVVAGTAHLISRNESHAFGGFLGVADTDGDTAYVGGAEFAKFFSNTTLALSAGLGQVDEADADLYGVNGEYRIFATDNLRFDLGAGWTKADGNGGDADILSLGAGVEYRIPSSPVSVGAGYTYAEADDFDIESNTFALTLKFDFGHDSLKARDRNGNTFGTFGGLGGALTVF